MKKLLLSLFVLTTILFGQPGSSAVPFLLIPTSVEANGMGGIMTVANSSSPSSMMFNPAQLGIMSQTKFLSTEIYSHHTNWLPAFHLKDLWLNNYSLMYGIKLPSNDNTDISVGFGYSRLFLNLGRFVITTDQGPDPIATMDGYESSDNFSLGVGLDLGFNISFGATIKKIVSNLTPFGTAQEKSSVSANIWATDIGLLLKFPIVSLLFQKNNNTTSPLNPFFDITSAYALNNVGGSVIYIDASQADPLPRNARLGWSIETGVRFHGETIDASLLTITIAREAENLLFERSGDGMSWEYGRAPIGNIDIYNNLLASNHSGYVNVRRGFSAEFFETITIRQGSYDGDGNLSYKTSGYTISTGGISKLFDVTKGQSSEFNPVQFILSHLEIRYSHCEYEGHAILGGTYFDNLIFSFHH